MTWVAAVLVSTTLFALVSILDKRLVADLFPSARSFNVAFGLLQAPIAAVLFAVVVPTVGFDGGAGIPWAIASGLLWAGGIILFFHGLRLEEVSRATPIQMTAPIFTALLAVTFLGESLNALQWVAIGMVVLGGATVTVRPELGRLRIANRRALVILLGASLVMGVAFVVSKEATNHMNVLAIQAFRAAAMGVGVLVLQGRGRAFREVRGMLRERAAMGTLVLTEGILAPIAAFMFVLALSMGPVSLVSAVSSSRPLIVLAASAALSTRSWNVLGEPLDRGTLGIKLASTVLIVGGVAVLALA